MRGEATFYAPDRESWRAWLRVNHGMASEVWLVFPKRHTGRATVAYVDAVEEALCFGWIDSTIRRIDDDRHARKFTPRQTTQNWSPLNLRRFERLVAEGRMTKAGLARFAPDPARTKRPPRSLRVPEFLQRELRSNPRASRNFELLAPSYRRAYIGWLSDAKREDTRRRRLAEALRLLEKGEKLGMK